MRDIKFRGKRVDDGKWIYGVPTSLTINCYEVKTIIVSKISTDELDGYHPSVDYEIVDPETVGQYTELKDDDNFDIYNGDILLCETTEGKFIAVVEFGNPNGFYSWGWQLASDTNFNKDILLWVETELDHVNCKVIGNIHDNPELMESEEER